MGRRLVLLLLGLLISSCGASSPTVQLPTADIRLGSATRPPIARVVPAAAAPASPPIRSAAADAGPTSAPVQPPAATQGTLAEPLAQYRAWIAEARALHPYSDSAEAMWDLLICESSGDPEVAGGNYYGLFQYDAATWAGEWNPYRDQPIRDSRAQIFATAKAWHDGNQHWWGCYPG